MLALWCVFGLAFSQNTPDLRPVSGTYAITNINIVHAPGRVLSMGTIVIKDGLILSVGKNISIPADAIIIKADSMYAYAGFIDGLSNAGVKKPKDDSREQPKDRSNPPPEMAGITPQVDVRNFLDATDKSIEDLRAIGFTTAHVVPYGQMLPGNGAIILLGGSSSDELVLVHNSSLFSQLAGASRMYPNTVIGVMAKYRQLYKQATLSNSYGKMYASNRSSLERPTTDRVLEAFYPVIDGRQPVLFKSEKVLETQRVLLLKKELGFQLMIGDLKEGWDIIGDIKASNSKVFLSLDLPDKMKEEKKDDKAKDDKGKDDKPKEKKDDGTKDDQLPEKKEMKSVAVKENPEEVALKKRKEEFIGKYTAQAAQFQKAGMTFGFSTMSAKSKDIHANLRRMIEAGLTEDQALAALTTSPAQLLGLSDRMGSIDAGKMANIVISDKPYFTEKARVRYVFVEGTPTKYEAKETPKGDPNAKVEIGGSWSMVTETPQGSNEGKVIFKKDGSGYSGVISGGQLPGEITLDVVEISGNKLHFTYSVTFGGQTMTIECDGTIEGDSFTGTASIGQFGSFPMEGTKDPKN